MLLPTSLCNPAWVHFKVAGSKLPSTLGSGSWVPGHHLYPHQRAVLSQRWRTEPKLPHRSQILFLPLEPWRGSQAATTTTVAKMADRTGALPIVNALSRPCCLLLLNLKLMLTQPTKVVSLQAQEYSGGKLGKYVIPEATCGVHHRFWAVIGNSKIMDHATCQNWGKGQIYFPDFHAATCGSA